MADSSSSNFNFSEGLTLFDNEEFEKAMMNFMASLEEGVNESNFYIGLMYEAGLGVKQDIIESAVWYKNGADKGSSRCQYRFGLYNFHNDNSSMSFFEALKWFELSIENGFYDAYFDIGSMYEHGLGVKKDINKAIESF